MARLILVASLLRLVAATNYSVAKAFEHGDDGQWSSFAIRVGSPEQYAYVLPATGWQETWFIIPGACNATSTHKLVNPDGSLQSCNDARGKVVDLNASATWIDRGIRQLDLDAGLGYVGHGLYGQDTLGLTVQDNGVTLKNQTFAGIIQEDFWLGVIGLGDQPTNFTGFNHPQPSFLQSLYGNSIIPSLSWGYTAGAIYRYKGILASLVFGGYDKSRFIPNNVTFHLTQGSLVVALRNITSATGLLTKSDINTVVNIDTSTPYIWLTEDSCALFEKAFNLTWNETMSLYLIDDVQHAALVRKNASITFTLADQADSPESVDIVLPYDSFDLKAGEGLLRYNRRLETTKIGNTATSHRYFPLKRTSQGNMTLGRTFLQEAYIFTDYHRQTFSISQTIFYPNDTTPADLVNVYPPGVNITGIATASPIVTKSKSKTNIIIPAIIVPLAAITLLVGSLLLWRRRKSARPEPPLAEEHVAELHDGAMPGPSELPSDGKTMPEMEGGAMSVTEVDGRGYLSPVESELDGRGAKEPVELDAGYVGSEMPSTRHEDSK